MKRFLYCLMLAGFAAPFATPNAGFAQQIIIETLDHQPSLDYLRKDSDGVTFNTFIDEDVVTETVVEAVSAKGALLRGLDKLTGHVVDIDLENGYSVGFGDLRVDLADCRHPADNATGEAYAFLSVFEEKKSDAPLFQGWMIASSPALNAMDHARYDIWVLRCNTAATSGSGDE